MRRVVRLLNHPQATTTVERLQRKTVLYCKIERLQLQYNLVSDNNSRIQLHVQVMGANGSSTSSHRSHHHQSIKKEQASVDDDSKSGAKSRFLQNFPLGYMNKEQFVSYYKLMNMSTMPDEECENLFRIADCNGDGQVTFDEYRLFCQILSSGSPVDRLRLTFKLYDKDNSKGITRDEIMNMLKGLYKSKNWDNVDGKAQRNADVIVKQVDGNADGVLTEDEFIGIASRDDLLCLIFGNE